MGKKYFMKDPETGKHRKAYSDGLFVHYPNTCNVHDLHHVVAQPFAPRATATPTRLAPSRYGFVAVCYETKGMITFFVQLNAKRVAWQRIEWPMHFIENWNHARVQVAVDNFIWVAECEEAGELLPRR